MPPFRGLKRAGRGRTVRRVAGVMNKTEAEYELHLMFEQQQGRVLHFAFEPFKLRLADATYYEPDFLVMRPDGTLEVHEVKGGHWEDDARVKIKVAQEQHWWFLFFAAQKRAANKGGGWEIEIFSERGKWV